MSSKYPFIPEYMEKALEDISIPLIDVLHGYLKVEMLEVEAKLQRCEGDEKEWLDGYSQALTNIYAMTYNLSIDRKRIEEKYYA